MFSEADSFKKNPELAQYFPWVSGGRYLITYIFYDCPAKSPEGRRNVCYDHEGQVAGKAFKPEGNAIDMAAAMGIELLTEEHYRELQKRGNFDTKRSSQVKTPSDIRKPGGALFADRRYGTVFVFHTSAPSYYGVRGFRGSLRV